MQADIAHSCLALTTATCHGRDMSATPGTPATIAPRPDEVARLHVALATAVSSSSIEVPDRGDARSFVAAARSALELGRPDDAVALARAALVIAPSHAPAWVVVGDACWARNDVVGARDAWSEALSLDDKDHATAVACARAQLMTGNDNAARALLTFVVTRTGSDTLRDAAKTLLASTEPRA